ncbi:hypothetical protein GCM10020256_55760 [Streptomyces thermocoprophilus]
MADKAPTLRFNCFLLREGLDSYEKAFRSQYHPDKPNGMRRLADSPLAPEGCAAYLKDMSEKAADMGKAACTRIHRTRGRTQLFESIGHFPPGIRSSIRYMLRLRELYS